MPPERIQRRGMADNYWSMGVPGPCGPCSEIYYDRGPGYGDGGGPVANEERYLEVWNLVFMQFERGAGGTKDSFPILGELPAKNIDTGMGLERMAAILQGVDNLYEIDTTRPILDRAAELSAASSYGVDHTTDVRLRVVADHSRASTMLIGDGVLPGNEGRGYVLRRILRRVVRNMRLLGAQGPTLHQLVATTIDVMAPQYPELADRLGAHPRGRRRRGDLVLLDAAGRHRPLRRGGRRDPQHRRARACPVSRRSRCTTPSASRSTSPWRWPPSRVWRSTRTASAG